MNRLLRRSTGDAGYVTFFLAEFDEETRALTYVNAGHNPPLLFRRREVRRATDGAHLQGKTRLRSRGDVSVGERVITIGAVNAFNDEAPILPLNASGPVIGTFLDTPYEQETVRAESGDVLVGRLTCTLPLLRQRGHSSDRPPRTGAAPA